MFCQSKQAPAHTGTEFGNLAYQSTIRINNILKFRGLSLRFLYFSKSATALLGTEIWNGTELSAPPRPRARFHVTVTSVSVAYALREDDMKQVKVCLDTNPLSLSIRHEDGCLRYDMRGGLYLKLIFH